MFKLKLLNDDELEVHEYCDFLLLRFPEKNRINASELGRQLFELKLASVAEVIATQTEILLKVDSRFDVNQLVSIKVDTKRRQAEAQKHRLPVFFSDHDEHWDLIEEHSGLNRVQYIDALLASEFKVAMPGFLPGFVYLDGLPDELHVPRRASPANRTESGSFAIGGKYAGVYSLASPAGWNIVGQTSARLFRLDQLPPLTVEVGDSVRLHRVEQLPVSENPDDEQHAEQPKSLSSGQLTVLRSGMLTLVQDHGRPGLAYYAIPASGALDSNAADLANVLLGNPETAAVIECNFVAPTLRFDTDATICLTGADMGWEIDGRRVSSDQTIRISSGSQLSGGKAMDGCRAYIGIHGTIDSQRTFGSLSVYHLGAFGANQGRPLHPDDTVRWNLPQTKSPNFSFRSWSKSRGKQRIVFSRGPEFDWLDETSKRVLCDSEFSISTNSNRMGARLNGPELRSQQELKNSVPLLPGMIQLASGGQCIVVLNDGQTTGGYPRIGYLNQDELMHFVQLGIDELFQFNIDG